MWARIRLPCPALCSGTSNRSRKSYPSRATTSEIAGRGGSGTDPSDERRRRGRAPSHVASSHSRNVAVQYPPTLQRVAVERLVAPPPRLERRCARSPFALPTQIPPSLESRPPPTPPPVPASSSAMQSLRAAERLRPPQALHRPALLPRLARAAHRPSPIRCRRPSPRRAGFRSQMTGCERVGMPRARNQSARSRWDAPTRRP